MVLSALRESERAMIREKYCRQGRKVTAHNNVNFKLKDENLIEVVVTSHGAGAGEAGADIDDEYISRTAQHYQPQPASENCTTVTLKRKEKLLKVTTSNVANTSSRYNI